MEKNELLFEHGVKFNINDLAIKALSIHFRLSNLDSFIIKAAFLNRNYGHTHYDEQLMY